MAACVSGLLWILSPAGSFKTVFIQSAGEVCLSTEKPGRLRVRGVLGWAVATCACALEGSALCAIAQ